MIRRFFKEGALYASAQVFSKGIAFLLLPLYTNNLSVSDYGVYDFIYLLAIIAVILVPLEIMQAFARYYQEYTSVADQKVVFSSTFAFTLFSFLLVALLGSVFSRNLSILFFGSASFLPIFRLGLIYIFTYGLFSFFQSAFRWQLKYKQVLALMILYSLSSAISTVILVHWFDLGLSGVLYALIIGAGSSTVLGILFSLKDFSRHISYLLIKRFLRFSIPLLPSSLAIFSSLYIDRFIIGQYLGLEALGIYGLAAKIASLIAIIIAGFNSALAPLIYTYYKFEETAQQLSSLFNLFIFICFILALFFAFFGNTLLSMVIQSEYTEAFKYIPFLIMIVAIANIYIFFPGLILKEKTFTIAAVSLVVATSNLILNLYFVPQFGLVAAVASTFSSSLLGAFLSIKLSHAYFPIPLNRIFIATVTLLLIGLTVLIGLFGDTIAFTTRILIFTATFAVLFLIQQKELRGILGLLK